MYSSLFRGGGRGESNLSNYYTGPMFIKNDASSGTTRCWSKASCIDITNAYLQSQLMQLRKKGLKKIGGLPGLTLTAIPIQGSNQFASASHVTGSWSLNLFVLYPEKMKMKWQIHEFSILEPRIKEIKFKIVPVKDATYAREKRCTSIIEVMVRIAASLNVFWLLFSLQLHYMKFIYSSFHKHYRWALD